MSLFFENYGRWFYCGQCNHKFILDTRYVRAVLKTRYNCKCSICNGIVTMDDDFIFGDQSVYETFQETKRVPKVRYGKTWGPYKGKITGKLLPSVFEEMAQPKKPSRNYGLWFLIAIVCLGLFYLLGVFG